VTSLDRTQVLELVATAVTEGSRQDKACEVVGVDERTLQRWQLPKTLTDNRHGPVTMPKNKLSNFEREKILKTASSLEFCNKSPHQIVPGLADLGEYVASESSFYRVLRASNQLAHRGRAKQKQMARPRCYEVTAPLQLLSWDITYLMSEIRGQYFYLYLFLDVFSRKAVGGEVHDRESMEYSSQLIDKICKAEGIEKNQISVHADNGGPMKGATMLATMQRLGIMPSFSRPSVSNDNPFSESLFKTLKYCPLYPTKPFASLEAARAWVVVFIDWYNNAHLHSSISFTTPASRHDGTDVAILQNREIVYQEAQKRNPSRWSGKTRNWKKVESVKLNWLKENESSVITADSRAS
jgi:putative transposase